MFALPSGILGNNTVLCAKVKQRHIQVRFWQIKRALRRGVSAAWTFQSVRKRFECIERGD